MAAETLSRIDDDEISTAAVRAMTAPLAPQETVENEIEALANNDHERDRLRSIASKLISRSEIDRGSLGAADVEAKLLPSPRRSPAPFCAMCMTFCSPPRDARQWSNHYLIECCW